MNKPTLAKAARIYAIAMVASMDAGGAQNEEEAVVMAAAIREACGKLATMGLTIADVATLRDCIALAKRN